MHLVPVPGHPVDASVDPADVPVITPAVCGSCAPDSQAGMRTALYVAALTLLLIICSSAAVTPTVEAETTEDAIQRIRAGRHVAMPTPTSTAAFGPAGKGMTIENQSGHMLHDHFSGPVSRSVVIPSGQTAGVELSIGRYQVAAEVPQPRIVPFYGEQAYETNTHYWLKFFVRQQLR